MKKPSTSMQIAVLILYPLSALATAMAAVPIVTENHSIMDSAGAGLIIALVSITLLHIGYLAVQKETEGGEAE